VIKLIFILIASVCFSAVFSQDDDIASIRKIYQSTNELIAVSKTQEGGGLYSNEITVNSNNGSWRAVGNYSKKSVFWYSDDPAQYVQVNENSTESGALVKAEISSEAAASMKFYTEYLFDNDQLIFIYKVEDAYEGKIEYRYYLKDEQVIRYMINQETSAGLPDSEDLIKEANEIKRIFLSTF